VHKRLPLLLAALILLAIDWIVKAYVHRELPLIGSSWMTYPYGGISLFKEWHGINCAIVHVANKGAAWGLFACFQEYLLYVRIAIIGGLLSYLLFVKVSSYRQWCLLLITAGALGNVLDYFIYGHVVDMIYFTFGNYSYPVFNCADSFICIGIFLLIAQRLVQKCASKKSSAKRPS
jgi:signal peptidase II